MWPFPRSSAARNRATAATIDGRASSILPDAWRGSAHAWHQRAEIDAVRALDEALQRQPSGFSP
jgi:hypothetical protein